MKRIPQLLIATSFALLAGAHTVSACSCSERPACGLARFASVDFVGDILSSHIVDDDGLAGGSVDSRLTRRQQVLVEARVIESFRGPQKAGDIVQFRTGLGGGDCGYPFKMRGSFLVDATTQNGNLYTGLCTLTAPVEESQGEIETLRKFAAGQRVPDVTGVLYRVSTAAEDPHKKPLAGIEVAFIAKTGRASHRTSTDSLGQFTFPDLPSGTYDVSLGLPHNLSADFTNFGRTTDQDEVPSLAVPSEAHDGAFCHVEIFVDSAASISGVVRAPGNHPLEGWINADSVKPDGTPWSTVSSTWPSSDGAFRLAHLPSGRYQIQFTSRAGFVKGDPQIIELKDGERRSGVVLTAK
jgi:hypothetical protein